MVLARIFTERLAQVGYSVSASEQLDQALAESVARASAEWPGLTVSPETFTSFLADRVDPARAVEQLAELHGSDLFVACGCVLGDLSAIRVLDQQFLNAVTPSWRIPAEQLVELRQRAREHLLVPREDGSMRIASYRGTGPLGGWLRLVVSRLAVDAQRAAKSLGREAIAVPAPALDPELAMLKERYRHEFEQALRVALRQLPARERTLLSLHYIEGAATSHISTMYGVSVRTVQRWLSSATGQLLDSVRRQLSQKLDLSPAAIDSLLGIVQSQLNLTLRDLHPSHLSSQT